jgi:hypothetical protein
MIIFAPAYDPSTKANLIIAKLIVTPTCVALFETKATKQEFDAALSKGNVPLFAMSHGERDALKAQNGEIALSKHDTHLLGKRTVYAFACHTAAELGKSAAGRGSIWWGYSDMVSCAIDSPSVHSIFAEIFTFIRDNFHTAISSQERQTVLAQLKEMCEEAEYQVDLIDEETKIDEIMEVYRTLRHIWDRLRIWIPDAQDPERHPDGLSPSFPWP